MPKGILGLALSGASELIQKLPIERWLIKPRDTSRDREELRQIIDEMPTGEALSRKRETPSEEEEESERPELMPRRRPKVRLHHTSIQGPTQEETVAYQNMEIGKGLFQMEKHFAQKLRIFDKPCDCGMKTIGLGLMGDLEETIPLVEDPDVYYRLIEWVKVVLPKSTQEASASGVYDEEYPLLSRQARDFRKEIMGTLDVKALFPPKPKQPSTTDVMPVVSEREKETILRLAHEKVDQALNTEKEPAQGGSSAP